MSVTTRRHPGAIGLALASALLVASSGSVAGQEIELPRASPRGQVTQKVGVSTITLDFGRPGVKGRAIFGPGGLVPFGGDQPWRTGADEPTTIELSHPAEIEGQPVAAGRYGLFTFPGAETWTVVLSENTEDPFAYDQEQDVLRVEVEPESAPFEERMRFEVEELDEAGAATVALRWDRKRVPFRVRFDFVSIVLDQARELLAEEPKSWFPWLDAARFSLDHGGDLEEALRWIERAREIEENRPVLDTQAQILDELGRGDEAERLRAAAERFGRDVWQRVDDIFERMGVEAGAWVADVGAGDGFLTTRLAKAVAPDGHVFAVEVDERALGRLDSAVEEGGHENVTVVRGAVDNPRLPPSALDSIAIVNAYHEMTEYPAMLEGILRALEPGGRLVLVEPMSERSRGKPREEQVRNHDLEIALARSELEAAGFEIVEADEEFVERPGGGREWLLVGRRPEP